MSKKDTPAPAFRVGDVVHGSRIIRIEEIEDIRATVYEIEHEATGAKIIHVHCNDRENLFSIGFRTPPKDSTGVAHILEHSVLAGSRKYPVKDAFNELSRGTLQTFINAFTYPDKTVYPVASQIRKDFFNLARVYTDLVLNPRLLQETFYQEGHHLEFEKPQDPGSHLTISGIVYNEMKGVYSSPDALMWKSIQENLYPDTPYAFDSGGNPEVIPFLTYGQLADFHRTFYSPSNARFFLYGDLATEEHLAFLEEMLEGFSRIAVDSRIGTQRRWDEPVRVQGTYPIGKDESTRRKTAVNLAWMMADNTDREDGLLLQILSRALIGSSAGPLRKALIDSGLGEDLSPVTGLDRDLRQMAFAVGLRGTDPEKADDVESLILRTIGDIVRDGFDGDIIAGALHRVEFDGKEMVRRNYPYAITLMGRVYHSWLYDGDPFIGLKFPGIIEKIRARWKAQPGFFEEVLQHWFLENRHRVLSIMEPSKTHSEEWEKTFRAMMVHSRESLSRKELEEIARETDYLRKVQEEPDAPESLATLPRLKPEDIPRRGEAIPTEKGSVGGVPVLQHDIFTNGIAYISLAFDTAGVPEELQPFLPVLGKLMTGMGAAGLSYDEMAKRIALKTGGVDYHLVSGLDLNGKGSWQRLVICARMLYRNIPDALAIVRDIISKTDLTDENRMRDLILEKRNRLHSSVVPAGHTFARRTAAGTLSLPAYRDEQWYGRTQLGVLSGLSSRFQEERLSLVRKLEAIRAAVFSRDRLMLDLTAENEEWTRLAEGAAEIVRNLPARGESLSPRPPELHPARVGVAVPAQVCYVARVFPAPPYAHRRAASLMVMARALSSDYLYKRVRVQGGAYGGMAVCDLTGGHLSFLSYRDPHLAETLGIYDDAVRFLSERDISGDDLEKAVIGTIGMIDRPMDPATKGFTALLREVAGITDGDRQTFRDRIFDTTADSIREAAGEYLSAARERSAVAVYASEERLRQANDTIRPPLAIEPLVSPAG